METAKTEMLEEAVAQLRASDPEAAVLLAKLRMPAFELSHLVPIDRVHADGDRRSWLARWKVGNELRERFQLAPEVLMLLTPWQEAQARDVEAVERELDRGLKCDRGLVLVLSFDDDIQRRLQSAFAETHRIWVVLDRSKLAKAGDVTAWLRRELTERLGVRDLFGATTPVAGWDFFGREAELADLRRTLLEGRPVCVYGLGKAGKSSLLKRLRSDWIEEGRWEQESERSMTAQVIPIHVDLQAVGSIEKNHIGVMRQVLAAMVDTLEAMGVRLDAAGLRREHRAWEFIANMAPGEVQRAAHDGLRALVRHVSGGGGAVVVILDEYERLYGADRGIPPAQGLEVLDLLRGLTQQFPRRFCFALAGRSREYAQRARIDGEVNPLYNFAIPYPIAGLQRDDLKTLVERIGARAGVRFDEAAVDLIDDESGGHPFLARQLCRIVERPVPLTQREPPYRATMEKVRQRVDDFHREVRWTMDEMLYAVQRFDREAPAFLSTVASDVDAPSWRPEVVEELVAIGVLARSSNGRLTVRIGAFRAWLRENRRPLELPRAAG